MIYNNTMATNEQANARYIKNYIDGSHKVLARKNFEFGGNTINTAKIVLQGIKSIINFHASYICGNPVTITGDKEVTKLLQQVYKKGHFNKVDYDIAKNVYTYGNAYEFPYRNEKGVITSKVINTLDAYPIYLGGSYVGFEEKWIDLESNIEHETVYTIDEVKEYENGVLMATYNNACKCLPIHYTSGEMDKTEFFGVGVVNDLIQIGRAHV